MNGKIRKLNSSIIRKRNSITPPSIMDSEASTSTNGVLRFQPRIIQPVIGGGGDGKTKMKSFSIAKPAPLQMNRLFEKARRSVEDQNRCEAEPPAANNIKSSVGQQSMGLKKAPTPPPPPPPPPSPPKELATTTKLSLPMNKSPPSTINAEKFLRKLSRSKELPTKKKLILSSPKESPSTTTSKKSKKIPSKIATAQKAKIIIPRRISTKTTTTTSKMTPLEEIDLPIGSPPAKNSFPTSSTRVISLKKTSTPTRVISLKKTPLTNNLKVELIPPPPPPPSTTTTTKDTPRRIVVMETSTTIKESPSKDTPKNETTTPQQRILLRARRFFNNSSMSLLSPSSSSIKSRISLTPTVNDMKTVEIIKGVDGTKLACFFTKFYVFSNHFHRRDLVEIDGIKYMCTEQYYMFYKARLFGDVDSAHRILNANSPSAVKKLGSQVQNFDAVKWKKISIQVMVIGCLRKFQQNADLRKQLFETNGAQLVEASPFDNYWGVGLSLDNPQIRNPKRWRGENVLGRLLTKLREILMNDPKYNSNNNNYRPARHIHF